MIEPLSGATRDGGRVVRWLAMAFLIVNAALNTVLVFQPYNTSAPSDQHYFDALTSITDVANFLLGALLCAALLAAPRTRDFAVGFGLGFCALWFADAVTTIRVPKSGLGTQTTVEWFVMGCRALALPAAICVLLVGLRRGRGPETPALRLRPKPRPIVLIGGLAAFACSLASDFVAAMHVTVPEQNGTTRSTDCCSFGSWSTGTKVDVFVSLAVVTVLILLAASVGSAAVASGIFAGMFTTTVGTVALNAAAICFPIEFQIGLQNRAIPVGTILHANAYPAYSPRAGFWLATAVLATLGLLSLISGLMYRPARDIYPAQAYHVPDTGLQRME